MKNNNLFLKRNIEFDIQNKKKLNYFSKKFEKVYSNITNEINSEKNGLGVLSKKFKIKIKTKDLKRFKKYKNIVIIGMGGSILGSEAVYYFLKDKIKKNIYFFNNLDENKIKDFKKKKLLSSVLFIVISKSGNTVETIYNLLSLKILKKNKKNVIVISEKKNNTLFLISKKYNFFFIEHSNFIGGRYSVLSEVGLIPAYLMGLNILKFRSKILDFLSKKNKNLLKKNAIYLSYFLSTKKFNNLIFLNYEQSFEKLLYWCQQLIAESLGKKNKGFLPIISNAPKDHHSLLQLYLDGPKDKIFNIINLSKNSNLKIKVDKDLKAINFLNNKDLNRVKESQKNALIKSLIRKKIPFREFSILENNEETLGQIFSFFILETVIIGKILNINPFDQPAVEQVKIDTKKILS